MKIYIQNKEVDLSKETSISLKWMFPVCWNPDFQQSYIDWFVFDATDEVVEVFEFSHHIDVENNYRIYENVVYIFEGISQKGILILKNANHKKYKACIVIREFPEGFLEKNLSEMVDETINLGAGQSQILSAAKSYSDAVGSQHKIAFPMIWNDEFYGDNNPDFGGNLSYYIYPVINNYDKLAEGYYMNDIHEDPYADNMNSLVPYIYLMYVLKIVFSDYKLHGSLFQDNEIDKLIVHNNYALDYIEKNKWIVEANFDYQKFNWNDYIADNFNYDTIIDNNNVMSSENEYVLPTKGYYKILFAFHIEDTANVQYIDDLWLYWNYPDDKFELNHLTNRVWDAGKGMYVADYALDNIVWINSSQVGNSMEVKLWCDDTVDITGSPAFSEITNFSMKIVPLSYNELNQMQGNVELKNHLPEINISTFLNSLIKGFGLSVFIKEGEMQFEFMKNIINSSKALDLTDRLIKNSTQITLGYKEKEYKREWNNDSFVDEDNFKDFSNHTELNPVNNLSDLPLSESYLGFVCEVKSLKAVFICKYNDDKNLVWERFTDYFVNVESDKKDKETIAVDFSTLTMSNYYPDIYVPRIKQQGTSKVFETGKNEPGFKLLFYHGMQNDGSGNYYPFASSSKFDLQGNEKTSFSLDIGNDGLYEKFSKQVINYIKNRKVVEMEFMIDALLLQKIKKIFEPSVEKFPIRKIRVKNQNYIPLEVDVSGSTAGIKSCKIKLL